MRHATPAADKPRRQLDVRKQVPRRDGKAEKGGAEQSESVPADRHGGAKDADEDGGMSGEGGVGV